MHHIFVNENLIDFTNKKITIDSANDKENFNHMAKSLRVNVGEKVLCSAMPFEFSFDYLCEVANVDDESITLSILEEITSNELPIHINLYQGISKFDKLEFIIEKAVELGAYSVTPISTEYCVAKIVDEKIEKKLDRFNKISKSAAEQSKRHIVPEVKKPMSFGEMLDDIGKEKNGEIVYNLLFYENAKEIIFTKEVIDEIKGEIDDNSVNKISDDKNIVVNVIIGPEGGFSENEIKLASNKGIRILSLGDRILRTETAAVTALSILMYEFSK